MVPGKGRVHHKDVAYKLVIRIEISQIVEHDQRIENSDSGKQQQLRGARDHYLSPWRKTEARPSQFMLTSRPEPFNDKLLANQAPQSCPEPAEWSHPPRRKPWNRCIVTPKQGSSALA